VINRHLFTPNEYKQYLDGGDFSVFSENVSQILFGEFFAEVLDEDIGEALGLFAQLLLAFLAGDEAADVDLSTNIESLKTNKRKLL
jgi:hypothetical protein